MSKTIEAHIIEHQTTAVALLNQAMRVVTLNPAAEALFGISATQALQTDITHFVTPSSAIRSHLEEVLSSHQGFSYLNSKVIDRDERELSCDLVASYFRVDNGRFANQDLVLLEIKETSRQDEIRQDHQRRSSQETTDDMIRGVAHEIKNPLGGILGAAQLLQADTKGTDLEEYAQIITDETNRLRTLVDTILGPNTLPAFELNNIHEVLERVGQLMRVESKGKLSVKRRYDPSIPEFIFDKSLLIQATLNIASNALQAMTEHNPSLEHNELIFSTRILRYYTIGDRRHKLVCEVGIHDNGPGIPDGLRERIFYPMISGRAEGTGLGLHIAQRLVQRHGGIINCISEPGSTIFTIMLPLHLEENV